MSCDARVWVNVEDAPEKVPDLVVADVVRNRCKFAVLDLSEEVGLELTEEGQFADVDDIKDYSTGPYIRRKAVIGALSHDIRVHVVRRATENVELLIGSHMLAEPKVDYLDILRRDVHKDVVQLEVAVSIPLRMHVCHAFDQLLEDVLARRFR